MLGAGLSRVLCPAGLGLCCLSPSFSFVRAPLLYELSCCETPSYFCFRFGFDSIQFDSVWLDELSWGFRAPSFSCGSSVQTSVNCSLLLREFVPTNVRRVFKLRRANFCHFLQRTLEVRFLAVDDRDATNFMPFEPKRERESVCVCLCLCV